ncbi:formate dehydrogenase accessory protein FdhE [Chloroflexota bacterium]
MAAETDAKIYGQFEEEGKERGLSLRLIEFYIKLFRIQSGAERLADKTDRKLKEKMIGMRLNQGLPLIGFDEIAPYLPLLNDVFKKVCIVFKDYADLFYEIPASLEQVKSEPSSLAEIIGAWLKKAEIPAAISLDNDNEYLILDAVIHATVKPVLASQAKYLIAHVDQQYWRREYCPICHGIPDLAYLDKEEGARWLLCSRCDSVWLFQRLQCPFCNNQDQKSLAYFTSDEEDYRLYVCELCQKYIKAIDLRNSRLKVPLPLERLLTYDMDRQAQEKGYKPGHA